MTDPVRPVAPREAEVQQLKTLNSALLGMIRRLQANLHFDPATRCYSVSDLAWFSQPYMGKTLARWLDAEHLAAAPVPCAASPLCSGCGEPMQRVDWRCGACGTFNDPAPRVYVDDVLALVNQALTRAGSRSIVGTKDGQIVATSVDEISQLRATGEGVRDAVAGLPAVPVPPVAPVEELAAVAPPLQGYWEADDWRRAFVEGAQWWEWTKAGATMWRSDRNMAEGVAEERFARLRGEAAVRVEE